MMNLNQLLTLSSKDWTRVVSCALATIAPGTLILFRYKPEVIMETGVGTIGLLSLALTLPVLTVNLIVSLPLVFEEIFPEDDSDTIWINFPWMVAACFHNSLILYPILLLSYFAKLSFKEFLGLVTFFEVTGFFWYIFTDLGKNIRLLQLPEHAYCLLKAFRSAIGTPNTAELCDSASSPIIKKSGNS